PPPGGTGGRRRAAADDRPRCRSPCRDNTIIRSVGAAASSPRVTIDPKWSRTTMPKTVILSSARTPIGKLGGGLSSLDAAALGGIAINAALERAEVAPDQVQHVVMGQVLQAGQGQIPSRQAQIKAGIPGEVSSEPINQLCA